jgi:hypothetical protein
MKIKGRCLAALSFALGWLVVRSTAVVGFVQRVTCDNGKPPRTSRFCR